MDAKKLVEDFYSLPPKYRTKDKLKQMLSENDKAGEVERVKCADIGKCAYQSINADGSCIKHDKCHPIIVDTPAPVDGLRDALNGLLLMAYGQKKDMVSIELIKAILSRHPATEEPLAVDSIGCCPKCGTLIKDMLHESLAVLADRKGFEVRAWSTQNAKYKKFWVISLCKGPIAHSEFWKITYPEAESKARAYLNTLPDREDK